MRSGGWWSDRRRIVIAGIGKIHARHERGGVQSVSRLNNHSPDSSWFENRRGTLMRFDRSGMLQHRVRRDDVGVGRRGRRPRSLVARVLVAGLCHVALLASLPSIATAADWAAHRSHRKLVNVCAHVPVSQLGKCIDPPETYPNMNCPACCALRSQQQVHWIPYNGGAIVACPWPRR